MNSVTSLIREPYGCFEQVSSTNYPNILAVQLMNEMGYEDENLMNRAISTLEYGYNKLVGYETRVGGRVVWAYSPS